MVATNASKQLAIAAWKNMGAGTQEYDLNRISEESERDTCDNRKKKPRNSPTHKKV